MRSRARTRCADAACMVESRAGVAAPLALLSPFALPVPRPVLVIREVEQLARRAKWRTCDLAESLGVSVAMLNRLRAGTHAPSREVLGAILRSFGTNAHVRELVLHFLEHELARDRHARLDAPRDEEDVLATLDPATRAAVRGFVREFLRRSLTSGAGLRLVLDHPNALRAAVSYVQTALDGQGISSVVLAGNATVTASLHAAALAAPLLIVERADFASAKVHALIEERARIRKPVFTTAIPAALDGDRAPVPSSSPPADVAA